jgi:hypothetical protein
MGRGTDFTCSQRLRREETIALWGEISGCPTDAIAWYDAFAFLKMGLAGVRLRTIRTLPGRSSPNG